LDKTTVRLLEDYRAEATARDHTWYSDVSTEKDGQDSGPTPEELLMGALGSCMAMTARMYARRKGWQLDGVEITLDFDRFTGDSYAEYDGDARFVHEIREQITLHGPLDASQRKRILEIMGRCPVRRILANPVFFVENIIEQEDQNVAE
jgi:uncharacterized OsmC-like protein